MGISGLHSTVKPYLKQVHVSKYRGQRLGCDAYSWLHRGSVGCAAELAEGSKPWVERGYAPPYVEFCLKMVSALRRNGVVPVLVFDGGKLPAKEGTNQQRKERKQAAAERAQGLVEQGQVEEARAVLAQTVNVTYGMAQELMASLRQQGVEFVVAPYEADAQLAFLCTLPPESGGVAAVVTEDSDLVAFGCRNVLFKCDTGGNALELCLDALFAGPPPGAPPSVASFAGWDLAMLQGACVLAGCDYLPSLRGISFKTAHKLIKSGRSLERALRSMRLEKRWQVLLSPDYCTAALRALHGFRHALVFDPNAAGGGGLVRLCPLPPELQSKRGEELAYLGPLLQEETARGICYGHLHPRTHEPHPGAPGPPYNTPTMATRQRLGSWLTSAAPHTAHAHLGWGTSGGAGGGTAAPSWHGRGATAVQHGAGQQSWPQQQQQQQGLAVERGSLGGASRSIEDVLSGLGAAWQRSTAAPDPAVAGSGHSAATADAAGTAAPTQAGAGGGPGSGSGSCNPFARAWTTDKGPVDGRSSATRGAEPLVPAAALAGLSADCGGHQQAAGASAQMATAGSCSTGEQLPEQHCQGSVGSVAPATSVATGLVAPGPGQAKGAPTDLKCGSGGSAAAGPSSASQEVGRQEPLAPITNMQGSLQPWAPSQEWCKEAPRAAGTVGQGSGSEAQPAAAQQQRQQLSPQVWGAGGTPGESTKRKLSAGGPGSSGKKGSSSSSSSSRGPKKKGRPAVDASQTRLSRFFTAVP